MSHREIDQNEEAVTDGDVPEDLTRGQLYRFELESPRLLTERDKRGHACYIPIESQELPFIYPEDIYDATVSASAIAFQDRSAAHIEMTDFNSLSTPGEPSPVDSTPGRSHLNTMSRTLSRWTSHLNPFSHRNAFRYDRGRTEPANNEVIPEVYGQRTEHDFELEIQQEGPSFIGRMWRSMQTRLSSRFNRHGDAPSSLELPTQNSSQISEFPEEPVGHRRENLSNASHQSTREPPVAAGEEQQNATEAPPTSSGLNLWSSALQHRAERFRRFCTQHMPDWSRMRAEFEQFQAEHTEAHADTNTAADASEDDPSFQQLLFFGGLLVGMPLFILGRSVVIYMIDYLRPHKPFLRNLFPDKRLISTNSEN